MGPAEHIERVESIEDICVLDHERYFIRGILPIFVEARLANIIPCFPRSLRLPTQLRYVPREDIPTVCLSPGLHPLAQAQYDGLTLEQAREVIAVQSKQRPSALITLEAPRFSIEHPLTSRLERVDCAR